MAFSDILKLKKEEQKKEETIFVRNLIVGSDNFTVALVKKLADKFQDSLKVLSEASFTLDNIKSLGPYGIRGDENINALASDFTLEDKQSSHSVFYKEMKFHKFHSRSKPMKLLEGENYYTQKHLKVDEAELLDITESDLGLVNDVLIENRIASIDKLESSELLDKKEWAVRCTNGLIIECENLYWGEGAFRFYDLLNDKNILGTDTVEYLESTKTPLALYVNLNFEKPVIDMGETIFFPLSFTHDWGHFIGDVISSNEGQVARFVTFVDKEESSEEDISKKIRLLKKNIEKNFESFKAVNYTEQVILNESSPCSKIDDGKLDPKELEQIHLHFYSYNAPLFNKSEEESNDADSCFSPSYFTRGYLALKNI